MLREVKGLKELEDSESRKELTIITIIQYTQKLILCFSGWCTLRNKCSVHNYLSVFKITCDSSAIYYKNRHNTKTKQISYTKPALQNKGI